MSHEQTKCKILWGLVGPLGIQPVLVLAVNHSDPVQTTHALEWIADIARQRNPPTDVEIVGGNYEPSLVIKTNEGHFDNEKPPTIVKWLVKRIKTEVENGHRYDFEIIPPKSR